MHTGGDRAENDDLGFANGKKGDHDDQHSLGVTMRTFGGVRVSPDHQNSERHVEKALTGLVGSKRALVAAGGSAARAFAVGGCSL